MTRKCTIFFIFLLSSFCCWAKKGNVIIILPENFVGFGAISITNDSDKDQDGNFYKSGQTLLVFPDRFGFTEIPLELVFEDISLVVLLANGHEVPITTSALDDTVGNRFWLLPKPASGSMYFFVGHQNQAVEFKKKHKRLYQEGFQISEYFDSLRDQG